ncbi:PREDICTED: uncharacterized protein LOC109220296 [Nicotiana attenuata]|uniref:Uncharacterized protein n=1 Tax=Nicotiana attenuata TaxID=49451 RepID=A0A1J6JV51_NICAT|nr:PREDICTED: uncharacterized protein LOC109220296 [Nicotiana attenuata]OIT20348.1 hypothetical protein A4A49_38646 [Nicotiana attenuata]
MAYLAPEIWPVCINVDADDTDLLNQIEIPEIDSTILMSFLDESQTEYFDDEKLRSVIQSLEAELDPNFITNNPAAPNLDSYNRDFLFSNMGSEDSSELIDVDFSWMDIEISSSPSPSNIKIIEFQVGSDYSQIFTYVPIEEEVYDSLWLETDLSILHTRPQYENLEHVN